MDDEDQTQTADDAAASAEEPDPRDVEMQRLRAELERERADRVRVTEAFSRLAQQPPQQTAAPALMDTHPDFSDAEDVGLTPAQAKYLYGKVGVVIDQARPKPRTGDEVLEEVLERAGLNTEDNDLRRTAIGVTFEASRVLKAEGIDPSSDRGITRMSQIVRKELNKEVRNGNGSGNGALRTAGIGGGSLTPGQKPKPAEKKIPTMVEAIKADQKKKRLY